MKHYAGLGAQFILTGSDHSYMLAEASRRSAFFRNLENRSQSVVRRDDDETNYSPVNPAFTGSLLPSSSRR